MAVVAMVSGPAGAHEAGPPQSVASLKKAKRLLDATPAVQISAAEQAELDRAPVAPTETTFLYKGGTIAVNDAAARDLACIEKGGRTTCYDSEAEMEDAQHLMPMSEQLRLVTAKAKGARGWKVRARAASHGGAPLAIWEHSDFHGWRVDANTSCVWFNLPGAYNDNASSWVTGNHTGILSIDNDGGSYRLEKEPLSGNTQLSAEGVGDPGFHNWNDQASSRYRRGC